MKKSTLFMACCIGLMLLASCKKDPVAPTISVFNGSGYATENTQVYSGEEITIGFVAAGENLTKLEVTLSENGTVLATHFENIEKQASYNYSHTFALDANGTVTVTGTVTDAAGQKALASFNIIVNEKPNAKFVGHYEGNALATGFYEAEISGMEPVQQEFTNREVPVLLDIVAGEGLYDVVATCTIDDRTMTATGIMEGNTVTFETINDVFTFDYDLGFVIIHPAIDISYSINGTLTDGQLVLDGISSGHGDYDYSFIGLVYTGTINLEATVGGSLNKTR